MRLSKKAIDQLTNTPQSRTRLALMLKVSDQWIYRGLKDNKDDGFLTKISALRAIAKSG